MVATLHSERLTRVTKGTLANVIGQVLNVITQLAQVPVLLTYWGNQAYGEWLAVSAVVAYLGTLDLGVQTYAVNRLTHCFAADTMRDYTRVLHTGLLANLVLPLAGFAVVLPIIFLAPITKWLHLTELDRTTAAWVIALLSLQAVYSVGYGMLFGVYRTIGEYAQGQMITNVRLLLSLLLTLAVVICGGGLLAVALTQVSIYVATSVLIYADLSRRRPEIKIGLSQADWRLARQFIGPSSAFLGIQVVNAIAVQGTLIVVNARFGAVVLVVFTSLRTLSNLNKQATATVQHALWPEFTALDAQSNKAALRTIHLFGAKVVMTITACSTVFLLVAGDRLVALWTHGRVTYDAALMAALLVLACSQAHWFCSWILMIACNGQSIALRYVTSASLIGLLVGYIASLPFGVVGFVYGLAITDAVICAIGVPWRTCRFIGESLRRFYTEVTVRSLILLAVTDAAVKLVAPLTGVLGTGIHGFVVLGLLAGGIGLSAAYGIVLNGAERERVRSTTARILGARTRKH